jgi:outer membrane lipoprotein SlyB
MKAVGAFGTSRSQDHAGHAGHAGHTGHTGPTGHTGHAGHAGHTGHNDRIPPRSVLQVVNLGEARSAGSAARQEHVRQSWLSSAYKRIGTPVYGDSTSDEASEANRSALNGAMVGALVGGLTGKSKIGRFTGGSTTHALVGAVSGAVAGLVDATERQRGERTGEKKTGLERAVKALTTAGASGVLGLAARGAVGRFGESRGRDVDSKSRKRCSFV